MTQRKEEPTQGEQPQAYSSEDAQRVVQIGEHAAQTLNSPVYNLAYQNVMQELTNDWLVSQPKETMKRESLYNQANGLVAVTEKLANAAEEARRLLSEQAVQNDPEAQRAEYLNTQGFGIQ